MARCCSGRGCTDFFDEREARRAARRYRRRGLEPAARRIFELVAERGVAGRSVLEIGGGVGGLTLELVRAGAAHATTTDLSTAYEDAARELVREAGLEGRVERALVDVAADVDAVAPADAVVMNRVVCCYPDAVALVGAAARLTRRVLVLSYPPRNVVSRAAVTALNALFRLRGTEFRTFVHEPARFLAAAEAAGLRLVREERVRVWQVAALERAA